MTTIAASFRPPWALTTWYDHEAIYLELPTKSGQPYITRFPFSEQGLMKALKMMKEIWDACEVKPTNGRSKHAMIDRRTKAQRTHEAKTGKATKFSEGQHEAARAQLKKMGLL